MQMNKQKQDRDKVRKLGFKIYKYLLVAKFMARRGSRQSLQVHWVIKQSGGYMVLNVDGLNRLNKINESVRKIKHSNYTKKIRERDLTRSAIFRTPPVSWGKLKICS